MKTLFKIFILFLISCSVTLSQEKAFEGKWKSIREKSTDIDSYQAVSLDFSIKKDEITISHIWGNKKVEEKMVLKTNGKIHKVEIKDWNFPSNIMMGLKMPIGEKKEVSAVWENDILKINEKYQVQCSQGFKEIINVHTFELSKDKNVMFYKISRNTRSEGPEIKYYLKKADINNAYFMKMTDDWDIFSKLPEQACLISIQGIANENSPNLYFQYGEAWDYRFTGTIFDYLKNQRDFTFTQLNSLEQAIKTFKDQIKGFIVWDKNVRTSLLVAFTLAGLEKGIVITEDLIPLAQKYGLNQIEDFRGKFTGQSDFQIYSWAYDKYWARCSRDYIVWIGGEHGKIVKPGVADFGMAKKMFFSDLSSNKRDTLEYGLTTKLFGQMNPAALVMGWHSYKKDLEETFVALSSSYGLRMEGLHTLPNMSFMCKVPPSYGFKFKNNHNVKPGQKYIPEKKVYIASIQTDGLGLGAWVKPGRGSIPYSWSVTTNWLWMAPSMLEYFYSQATPNDYFIGSPVPGYMYPKIIPKKYTPKLIEVNNDILKKLDINVIEFMDYSAEGTIEGNSELTKEVVDIYYEGMPDIIGFANGYRPSFTFTCRDKRPLISYEYYLSKDRPEEEAVGDLKELAKINTQRPYFILAHIRQWSDISRIKSIYDTLGPEFEIVPLDIFMKMAGENPTFKERYMEKK